jgi:hypothetical protein
VGAVLGSAPTGDCYRWAYRYVLKHPQAFLYQGYVRDPDGVERGPFGHAWVIHKGIVKDWQTMVAGLGGRFRGCGYPETIYNQLWRPARVQVFDAAQARSALQRNGHYGPWENTPRSGDMGEFNPDPNAIIKRCSCGRTYTYAQWQRLPDKRIWELPWGEIQELRNCVCRSTMNIVVQEGTPE